MLYKLFPFRDGEFGFSHEKFPGSGYMITYEFYCCTELKIVFSGEGEGREGSGTCSEIQEIDALGAAGQDDVELVAGPDLADQGL